MKTIKTLYFLLSFQSEKVDIRQCYVVKWLFVILDTEYGRNEQSGFSASIIKDFSGSG